MTDYKKVIYESDFIHQLLKEVAKVSDFSAVSEELYYEAVLALNSGMTDESTQGVLSAFVKMTDVPNLTDEPMGTLLSKKPFTSIEEHSNTKKLLLNYFRQSWKSFVGIFVTILFLVTSTKGILENNSRLASIAFLVICMIALFGSLTFLIIDLRYILSPVYRDKLRGVTDGVIGESLRDMVYNADKIDVDMTPYISRLDFPDRAFLFINKLHEDKGLGRTFTKTRRYTPEYYDIISKLELKYYEMVNN